MSKDPFGYGLLEKRTRQCPAIVESMLEVPEVPLMPSLPSHFIVTGVGSSEAHAHFFCSLINQFTPASASFYPLNAFYAPTPNLKRSATLVVFSQGLSSNALLPLRQYQDFAHTVVFTATTVEGAIRGSKKKQSKLLQRLKIEDQTIVHFPIEAEYDLLLRTIGPITGYIAILNFISAHWPEAVPPCPQAELLSAIITAPRKVTPAAVGDMTSGLDAGSLIIANHPLSEYTHNLAFKIMEGLFRPIPHMCDMLAFAHGPFQEFTKNPKPIFLLTNSTRADQTLKEHLMPLILHTKAPFWEINSKIPSPWNIIEYEAIFNEFILQTIEGYGISQRDWPGKKHDSSLYNIQEPLS